MAENGYSDGDFSLQRLISLERENYSLTKKLESISREKDELWAKYDAVSKDYMRLENLVHRVGRKMTDYISAKKFTVHDNILSRRVMPFIDTETQAIVDEIPTTRTQNAVVEKILDVDVLPTKALKGEEDIKCSNKAGNKDKTLELVGPCLDDSPKPGVVEPLGKEAVSSPIPLREINGACSYFDNMNLKETLLNAIQAYGQEKLYVNEASSIIPFLLTGQDAVVVEDLRQNPGVNRIAMYAICILQQVDASNPNCQALILVPYRILAQKILNVLQALGSGVGIQSHACIGGGTKVKQEKTTLLCGIQLVVGTPGRVYDMILRNSLKTESILFLVMDEAQYLLSDIFVEQTKKVLHKLPIEKRMLLFTAARTQQLEDFCQQFMKTRRMFQVQAIVPNLDCISHFYVSLNGCDMKAKTLLEAHTHYRRSKKVIYCNTQKKVGFLKQLWYNMREPALFVHSGMKPELREKILKEFKAGPIRTLIATDMPLRSFDEDFQLLNVSLLINYELPATPQQYFSRILLCGSYFEKNGIVINFTVSTCQAQLQALQEVEEFFKMQIIELTKTDAGGCGCNIS